MNTRLTTIAFFIIVAIIFSCNDSDDVTNKKASCLPANLQSGVIAFYPFSNGSLNDVSGNNYNLTNSTSASSGMDRGGNPNCAYNFNQTNGDFIEYSNPTFLDNLPSSNLSISFWYKSNNQSQGVFISRDENNNCPNTTGQWSIQHTNNVISFGANGAITFSYGVETSTWEHIVITSNSAGIKFYKNGILASTSNDFTYCSFANPTLNQGNLFIGKSYDGLIDDIIIYDRILTSTEINELYNLPACCL